ncbi:MAG TPA: hypothetical protein ENG95_06960 [Nitrospirae bacterium]|nr:hypothetical protein [Nitrospirota bacterium]
MPERVKEISGTLSGDDFKDGTLRSIYRKIIEGPTDLNDLIMKCEGEEKDVLSGISLSPELEDPEKVLSDCIRWMNESKRGMLKRELQVKIKEAEAKKDLVLLKQLQTDFQKLLRTGKQQ